jgi:hypothetical protein
LPGELLMTCNTSAVAACCSLASAKPTFEFGYPLLGIG